ncbi:hypothetical protein LXA43DRAFT_1103390 [Ganoderma leucocontextum]|nr:hypothetical protein LXA43DRAFT_1103390 [Ganoderma leucocontextum]
MSEPRRFFGPCKNPKCDQGCGFFIPPEGHPDALSAFDLSLTPSLLASRCQACDCFGGQHLYQEASIDAKASAPPSSTTYPSNPTTSASSGSSSSLPSASTSSSASSSSSFIPSFSATEESLSGSRSKEDRSSSRFMGPPPVDIPAFPTAASFKAQAERREQREKGLPEGESASTSDGRFDPTANIYKTAAQLKSKPPSRKRHRQASQERSSSKANAKRSNKATSDKSIPTKLYHVCLTERTTAVHRGTYRKPALRKLEALDNNNHVQVVRLPKDDAATIEEINTAVDHAFKPFFPEFEEKFSWVLLNVQGKGSGHHAYLQIAQRNDGRADSVNGAAWARATSSTTVRGGGSAFKSLVYISLTNGGRDMKITGLSDEESGDETDNDEPDDFYPAALNKSTFNVDGHLCSMLRLHFDSPFYFNFGGFNFNLDVYLHIRLDVLFYFSFYFIVLWTKPFPHAVSCTAFHAGAHDPIDQGQGSENQGDDWSIPPQFGAIERLLHNMQAPNPPAVWWHLNQDNAFLFSGFFMHAPFFELAIRGICTSETHATTILPPVLLLQQIMETLLPTLNFLEALAIEFHLVDDSRRYLPLESNRRVREEFALGPYGLHGVMKTLRLVYEFVLREDLLPDKSDRGLAFLRLEWILIRTRAVLLWFRHWVPRRLWLPRGGFQALQVAYEDAEEAGYLEFIRPDDLFSAGPTVLLSVIIDAFGHHADPQAINSYGMTKGAFGLSTYISDVNDPLLDSMPLDHPHYSAMYDIAELFSAALASKLTSAGKKSTPRATTSERRPSPSEEQIPPAREPETTAEGPTQTHLPKTRAYAKQEDAEAPSAGPTQGPDRPKTRAYTKRTKASAPTDEKDYIYIPSGSTEPSSDDECDEPEHTREHQAGSERPNTSQEPDDSYTKAAPDQSSSTEHSAENDENVPPPPAADSEEQRKRKSRDLHEKDLSNAQGLRRIRTWRTLVTKILQLFPHPNVHKRPHSSWPESFVSERRQYVTLMLLYHSDHNMKEGPEWRELCHIITQLLNEFNSSKRIK